MNGTYVMGREDHTTIPSILTASPTTSSSASNINSSPKARASKASSSSNKNSSSSSNSKASATIVGKQFRPKLLDGADFRKKCLDQGGESDKSNSATTATATATTTKKDKKHKSTSSRGRSASFCLEKKGKKSKAVAENTKSNSNFTTTTTTTIKRSSSLPSREALRKLSEKENAAAPLLKKTKKSQLKRLSKNEQSFLQLAEEVDDSPKSPTKKKEKSKQQPQQRIYPTGDDSDDDSDDDEILVFNSEKEISIRAAAAAKAATQAGRFSPERTDKRRLSVQRSPSYNSVASAPVTVPEKSKATRKKSKQSSTKKSGKRRNSVPILSSVEAASAVDAASKPKQRSSTAQTKKANNNNNKSCSLEHGHDPNDRTRSTSSAAAAASASANDNDNNTPPGSPSRHSHHPLISPPTFSLAWREQQYMLQVVSRSKAADASIRNTAQPQQQQQQQQQPSTEASPCTFSILHNHKANGTTNDQSPSSARTDTTRSDSLSDMSASAPATAGTATANATPSSGTSSSRSPSRTRRLSVNAVTKREEAQVEHERALLSLQQEQQQHNDPGGHRHNKKHSSKHHHAAEGSRTTGSHAAAAAAGDHKNKTKKKKSSVTTDEPLQKTKSHKEEAAGDVSVGSLSTDKKTTRKIKTLQPNEQHQQGDDDVALHAFSDSITKNSQSQNDEAHRQKSSTSNTQIPANKTKKSPKRGNNDAAAAAAAAMHLPSPTLHFSPAEQSSERPQIVAATRPEEDSRLDLVSVARKNNGNDNKTQGGGSGMLLPKAPPLVASALPSGGSIKSTNNNNNNNTTPPLFAAIRAATGSGGKAVENNSKSDSSRSSTRRSSVGPGPFPTTSNRPPVIPDDASGGNSKRGVNNPPGLAPPATPTLSGTTGSSVTGASPATRTSVLLSGQSSVDRQVLDNASGWTAQQKKIRTTQATTNGVIVAASTEAAATATVPASSVTSSRRKPLAGGSVKAPASPVRVAKGAIGRAVKRDDPSVDRVVASFWNSQRAAFDMEAGDGEEGPGESAVVDYGYGEELVGAVPANSVPMFLASRRSSTGMIAQLVASDAVELPEVPVYLSPPGGKKKKAVQPAAGASMKKKGLQQQARRASMTSTIPLEPEPEQNDASMLRMSAKNRSRSSRRLSMQTFIPESNMAPTPESETKGWMLKDPKYYTKPVFMARYHRPVCSIQAAARGYITRKHTQGRMRLYLALKQVRAACQIQALVRGYSVRRKYLNILAYIRKGGEWNTALTFWSLTTQ